MVVLCLIVGLVINILEPRQLGILMDSLTTSHRTFPVSEAALWMFFNWIPSGILYSIRRALWEPIELAAQQAIKTAAYDKIMDLSCDFHTEKQSGELFTSIDQGASVVSLLESLLFQTAPMFVDIGVAFFYL